MLSIAEWTTTLQDPATGAQLHASLEQAMDATAAMTSGRRAVSGRYASAYRRAKGLSDEFATYGERSPSAAWTSASKPWQSAKAAGVELLNAATAMRGNDALVVGADGTVSISTVSQARAALGDIAQQIRRGFENLDEIKPNYLTEPVWHMMTNRDVKAAFKARLTDLNQLAQKVYNKLGNTNRPLTPVEMSWMKEVRKFATDFNKDLGQEMVDSKWSLVAFAKESARASGKLAARGANAVVETAVDAAKAAAGGLSLTTIVVIGGALYLITRSRGTSLLGGLAGGKDSPKGSKSGPNLQNIAIAGGLAFVAFEFMKGKQT